jgi:hypothetical protein
MSDSTKKTIIVNPDSLEENSGVSSRTRSKKNNVRSKNIKREVLKTLKKQKTISGTEQKDIKTTTVKNKNFLDDLKESLNILETVSKERRKERNKTMKLKKDKMVLDEREYDEVTNESSSSLPYLKKEPVHGCLKGGNKPTYSQTNKTKKRSNIYFHDKPIQSVETIGNIDIQSKAMYSERQRKLQEMKETSVDNYGNVNSNRNINTEKDMDKYIPSTSPSPLASPELNKPSVQLEILPKTIVNEKVVNHPIRTPIPTRHTSNQSHSYNLRERIGNSLPNMNQLKNEVQSELEIPSISSLNKNNDIIVDVQNKQFKKVENQLVNNINKTLKNKKTYNLGKKDNQISVLIPNNKTRKAKRLETDKIEDISFYNKKRFLEERGFIKKGSNAPEFVLNELYKNILLSGNVTNTNTEKQLYNYMNKE